MKVLILAGLIFTGTIANATELTFQNGLYQQSIKEQHVQSIEETVLTAPIYFEKKLKPLGEKLLTSLQETWEIVHLSQTDDQYKQCRTLNANKKYALSKIKSAQKLFENKRIDQEMYTDIINKANSKAAAYDAQLSKCKQTYNKGLL